MKKIFLLADDDVDDAEIFSEALSRVNRAVEFHHVANGRLVTDYLSAHANELPDVIFLDLNMPEMNGWDCLALLRSSPMFRHIPVLVYSTSSSAQEKDKAVRLGANGFFTKPSELKELVSVLNEIIAHDFGPARPFFYRRSADGGRNLPGG